MGALAGEGKGKGKHITEALVTLGQQTTLPLCSSAVSTWSGGTVTQSGLVNDCLQSEFWTVEGFRLTLIDLMLLVPGMGECLRGV